MFIGSRGVGAAVLVLAALSVAGCGSFKKKANAPTKGEVYLVVAAAVLAGAPDEDGDGLPDDVEDAYLATLGTDKHRRDSDGDGIDDAFEVFGTSWLHVRAQGRAGTLMADEPAQGAADPARGHDAELVDSDGDGVPDYLEYAGYSYDWRLGKFVLDPNGYHTDPLQWSTDQDAYSDGMEVSGINMDVAVKSPGNHPLVPAYPDIVIELTGYSIALNEQITDGSGGQIEKGTTWSREVRNEHSTGSEKGFTLGAEYKFGGTESGLTLKSEFSAKWSTTDTHSEAVTTGGSFTDQVNWNQARSYSPADAARIKLFVRVHNRGTAPASNLVPTINMRVAGANVATFEPELPIYMLLPGAAYPPDPGTAMVIDHDATGNPLSLTDWELRALQRGGPVTLAVTQKRADVMRLSGEGAWERVGDVNEYLARIVSVSAGVLLDLGTLPDQGDQARLARRLVYAGQGPTAPPVTLAEALRWTDGFAGDAGTLVTLTYQREDGTAVQVPLATAATSDGWRVEVDPVTMEASWPHGTKPSTAGQVFDLVLRPGSQVSLRAPRPPAAALPVIHNAYAVPTESGYRVVVCASDYDAVGRVVFVDKFERELELARDGRGPWFYSVNLPNYTFRTPQDPSSFKQEVVKVESLRTAPVGGVATPLTATSTVAVEYTPVAQAPILRRVSFDSKAHRFYARVEPGGSMDLDQVDWVRLYHPDLVDGKVAGYKSLATTIFQFEDPYGWEVTLEKYLPGMRLVAHTTGGKYTSRDVGDMQDLTALRNGSVWLSASNDWESGDSNEFWSPLVELDEVEPVTACGPIPWLDWARTYYPTADWAACVAADPRVAVYYAADDYFTSNDPARKMWDWWRTIPGRVGLPELYLRSNGVDTTAFVLGFHIRGAAVSDFGGRTSLDYYTNVLGYPEVLNLQGTFLPGYPLGGGAAEAVLSLQQDTVLVFETSDGRIAKARVAEVSYFENYVDIYYSHTTFVRLDYVVYPRPEDVVAPGGLGYRLMDASYPLGKLIEPANETALASGAPPEAFRLCAAAGTPCLAERPDLLPAGMTFNTRTGAIGGTPMEAMALTTFQVFAWNYGGETSTTITMEVLAPPPDFSYPASTSCRTGYPCAEVAPVLSGAGTIDRFDVAPALPAGLTLGVGDGILRGTPAPGEVTNPADYVVTASNRAGSRKTAVLRLDTPLGAPAGIVYPGAPYVFTSGTLVSPPRTPTALGGPATWTVSPGLPAGLLLGSATGTISGTPGAASTATSYLVTATNAAGTSSATVTITVE